MAACPDHPKKEASGSAGFADGKPAANLAGEMLLDLGVARDGFLNAGHGIVPDGMGCTFAEKGAAV
jgi:hypothetical protein